MSDNKAEQTKQYHTALKHAALVRRERLKVIAKHRNKEISVVTKSGSGVKRGGHTRIFRTASD